MHLVDEFYDRSVNLLLAADVAIDELYVTGRLALEMDRCRSRLLKCNQWNIWSDRIDRTDKECCAKLRRIYTSRLIKDE